MGQQVRASTGAARPRMTAFDRVAMGAPPAIALSLLAVYLVSPSFYLEWVLEEKRRERQAVEILTVLAGMGAGVVLLIAAARLWVRDRAAGRIANLPGSALIAGVVALATIFFAGEEVSWGQTWFGGETPEWLEETIESRERNLHNSSLPIQSLGSLFLVGVFIVFPVMWALRRPRGPLPLPADWGPAVPRWSVSFAMMFAFAWKSLKDVFLLAYGAGGARESAFYMGFVEQINEQKELLIALALLLYGVSLLRARKIGDGDGVAGAPAEQGA